MEGNPFIGLFGKTNDEITLLPRSASLRVRSACEEAIGTRIVYASIAESNLIGLFCALNSNGIILPSIATKSEINEIKKFGLRCYVMKDKRTAVGNNIATNDKGALINPNINKNDARAIAECLGVEVHALRIAGYETVGSACVATNNGFLLHNEASEEEIERVESALGVRGGTGTANMGVPFVGLCLLANKRGYVVGESTSGFEFQRIDESLGFL